MGITQNRRFENSIFHEKPILFACIDVLKTHATCMLNNSGNNTYVCCGLLGLQYANGLNCPRGVFRVNNYGLIFIGLQDRNDHIE
jgi:hypothetical protein